jgi:hypothetical protein
LGIHYLISSYFQIIFLLCIGKGSDYLQSIDHLLLAKELVKDNPAFADKRKRNAFIFGSIEPDLNFFSYLRGSFKYQKLRGHNNPNTNKFIEEKVNKFQNREIKSLKDYFDLGVLIHYLADSFTYPHNDEFNGTIKEHLIYEENLHYSFLKYLNNGITFHSAHHDFVSFIKNYHQKYLNKKPSFKNDSIHILKSCNYLMSILL